MNRRALMWALMVAVPLVWQNERTIARENARRPLVIVPASDTARFERCRRAGGFVDMTDDGTEGALPVPFACEYRPVENVNKVD